MFTDVVTMLTSKVESQSFLFASNINNPDKLFQGYCFIDSDYVFGDVGREKYFNVKGIDISGGEDGCYISALKVKEDFYFSSDFSGFKKIFYYWSNKIWVVSNSIYLISQHLKKSNIPLQVNASQLASIGVSRDLFCNQLYSTNTFVEGIRLLPLNHTLKISKSGYSFIEIANDLSFDSYELGLTNFIIIWISRFSSLLRNNINIRADLTGGADSRTIFTLLKNAAEYTTNSTGTLGFRTGHTPTNTTDLEIATKVGLAYGYKVNNEKFPITNIYTSKESIDIWKVLCLGVYHPIYIPTFGAQPDVVSIGGASAGNSRVHYKENSPEALFNKHLSGLSPKWLSYNALTDCINEFNDIKESKSDVDPLIVHYRRYRNRMHAGRTPQYSTMFNPFASKFLENVAEKAGALRLSNAQINYDLMSALLPGVLDIPFDLPSKEFNEIRQKNLTKISVPDLFCVGSVYIEDDISYGKSDVSESCIYELLNEEFQTSKRQPFVVDFFGKPFIDKANNTMLDAIKNKRFNPHPVDAQGISAIIAGGLFD